MRLRAWARGPLSGRVTLPALLVAAQAPPPVPTGIHRTGADWVTLLAVLGIFWLVALGTAVTLWLLAREADRLHRLEPGPAPRGGEAAGYSPMRQP